MKKIFLTALTLGAAWCMSPAQTTNPEELSNLLYTQIISAYNAQNWEQVTDLVQRLIDAGADIEDLEVNYCIALSESGCPDEAADRMELYLESNPEDYQGWYALGDIQIRRSMPDKAIEAYTKSAELNSMFARPYVAIARLYGSDDPEAAVDAYCKAMHIFLLAEQPQGAIQFGSEAMNIDAGNQHLLLLLGESLSMAGLEEKALPFYAEAISVASIPENADFETVSVGTQRIAMIYYKKGEYAKSLAFISTVSENKILLSNFDPVMAQELLMLTAANYQKLGKDSDAESYLTKAREVNPESEIDDFYQSLLQFSE